MDYNHSNISLNATAEAKKKILAMIGAHKSELMPMILSSIQKNKIRSRELFLACERVLEQKDVQFYSWAMILQEVHNLRHEGKTLDPRNPPLRHGVTELLDDLIFSGVNPMDLAEKALPMIKVTGERDENDNIEIQITGLK